jgi:hypothetical protein
VDRAHTEPETHGTRLRYVCIPGSPFTGSTLLGTLLNEHPDIASIGAAVGLPRRPDLSTYLCSCGARFRDCEFWNDIAARTAASGYPVKVFESGFWNTHLSLSRRPVVNALLVRSLGADPLNQARDAVVTRVPAVRRAMLRMGWHSWSLASAVLARTGKSVFIDTSRDHQRPKYLALHPKLDLKVIHLFRDPRGNSASIMKHTGADVATAAKQWKHYNVEANRVRRYLPEAAWLSLRYEDLCADPPATFDRIADFLGVARTSIQIGSLAGERHIIGNKMRLRAVSEIREDRSWQTRLDGADLDVLARIAGPTSREFGYDWP